MVQQPLSLLNDPPEVLEGPQLLHNLINFEKHSSACAIDFTSNGKRRQYSYREVQSCVATLLSRIEEILATNGTPTCSPSKQHVIPLLLPQSPGLYISQLAILESGGAFCPINLDSPEERIKFVVEDVTATIIITSSEFANAVSWEGGPAVIFVDEFPTLPQDGQSNPRGSRKVTAHDLAYVMYTSGSSGTPKGVALSHLAVSQSLLAHEKLIPSFNRFLQFAAPSFDVSVFEIFFPLTRGCTLVGCNRSQLLNDLPGMINELGVDAAELTPTVVGSLLQKRSYVPNLKLLLTIGEMLTRPIIAEFGGSDERESMLYGMYGPTEAAIHCTIHPRMEASAKPGNIGVPFDTVSVFIAAASSDPGSEGTIKFLPTGELGELVLGGPQLAQGYLNREEQNKVAFIHVKGKDYYRTGDKARLLEDGTIEILGRMSAGQVKLRGQRVELGEIEEAVYKQPGIKTATAIVLGSALIVFALVDGEELKSEQAMKTCAKWLPKFMVPSEIILLRQFPYLPSGKVDKRRLEADYQKERDGSDEERNSPASQTERIVERVLRDILGPFTRRIRLAAAGLDSLVAIRVASQLRSLGFSVTTIAVLQADTIRELAEMCEISKSTPLQKQRQRQVPATDNVMAVMNGDAKDIESIVACTPLQSAMLSETAFHAEAYRNWVELDITGALNPDYIISALHALAQQNPILRTGFAESGDHSGFVQIVWKTLASSQIEQVEAFNYNFDASTSSPLHHPLGIQFRHLGSSIKLLIRLHHAQYDAWSLELLLDDLDNLLMGQSPPLRPSFSTVVHAYLDGTLATESWTSKEYWRDHLSFLDLRQVPSFHSGKATSTGLAVTELATLIPTSAVEATAKRLFSSPQSLFQAAYALILSSYLGSSDICFGTIFSGRTLPVAGIEDIAGPCLATLPIRVDVSIPVTLGELVQDLNRTNRKHLEHSTIPLSEIKSISGVHPRQPLFDTLLIWQQTLHSYAHARKHVSLVDSVDNLEFNLTLEIVPGTANILLRANYQQSLFPQPQVDFLLKQIEQLTYAIIKDETTLLENAFSHLDIDILSVENERPQTTIRPGSLSSPVERIADEDPDRPAIDFARSINSNNTEIQRTTYFELNSRANQMGRYLLMQNLLPDELVCICMEKCSDLYVSILASAKVGAGYLPVTPDVPEERLDNILREAKVKIVIAQSSSRPLLSSYRSVRILYVDEVDFTVLSSMNIPPRSSSENLSYCVFTSGSTGSPKGVLITQGNLLSNLDVLEDLYPANKRSRLLQSCSQAFDVSVFEIFFTWRIGGCLCSATKDVLFRDIENAIRVLNVTHLSLTPTVAALINPKNVPNVQFLVTAGEAVTQKVFNAWADNGLYQGYGPSETTNICTINQKVSRFDSINNIGPPLKNTSAFVLGPKPDFSLIPRGGEGEFCFGGAQVFRGYMDRDQEVEKVIEHPTFGRLYRSGDFGRLMPDGSLAFIGRKDDQIKIRGQRVELGEINNILLRSEEVQDCMTMIMSRANHKSQQLVCFWTPRLEISTRVECLPPVASTLSALFKNLESALPPYMIPSALIPISCLPSTSQGKIDKQLLMKLYEDLDIRYIDSTTQASRSPSDHTWTDLQLDIVRALVQQTKSPLSEITPNTSFFSLGIDSISAISFSRILRENVKYDINISDILKFPSVARLAEKISSRGGLMNTSTSNEDFHFGFEKKFLDTTVENCKRAGKTVENIFPCTPLQEAMLSAAQLSSETLYNNLVVLDIHGSIEKLQICWQEMARRHEILRTCFIETEMSQYAYAQVVLETFDPKFNFVDSLGEVSKINETVRKSCNPTKFEPPYRFDLVQTPESTKLLISMHHALYDGLALEVLYEEVEALYHDRSLSPSVSFAPFLQHMVSMNMEDSDKFWGTTLKGCSFTRMKPLYTQFSEAQQKQNRTMIQHKIAASPLSWVEESIKKHSTSMLAVCHAVWAAIISERLQETDVCFGNVTSGRTVPVNGIERLVAPCFNTVPTRLQDIDKLSYLEAFRKSQNLNADSLQFQLTPLRRIQSKYSPDGTRLFDTLFILQQQPKDLDNSIWSISEDDGAMDLPLVCEVVPHHSEDTLEIIIHSHSSFVTTEDAIEILEYFSAKIQMALENPRRQIHSSAIKEHIFSTKINQEEKLQTAKVAEPSNAMTPEELNIRNVISGFTDVPVENIGRDISIFRLGLDSISTVQVAACLRKQGHSVLASDVLEHPSIAELALHLSQVNGVQNETERQYDFAAFDMGHREEICSKVCVPSEEVEAIRPCTVVQQGMIAQSLHSQGQEYINSTWFELHSDTSISRLKAAWTTVCREHEMLRSGFVPIDDPKYSFALVTYTPESFVLPWVEEEPESSNLIIDQLSRGPWRLNLIKNDKTLLKFTAHHALYDGQSLQMMLSDVARAYDSKSSPPRLRVESLLGPILRRGEEDIEDKKLFWQRDENKIVINRFPDLTPLRVSDANNEVLEICSQNRISDLEEMCKQNSVTMQAACQAAWARLLAAYIGEAATTFGMTLSGRSVHEDADLISFPSIVTLPVRCDVTGKNKDFLSRTMVSNSALHKHQFTPLTLIQRWGGFPEGKIFDTLFAYQKLPDGQEVHFPWTTFREEAAVDYAVSLEVQPTKSDDLALRLTFRTNLIPVEHADLLLRQYDALLLDTLRNPENFCDLAPRLGTELLSITPAKESVLPDSVTLLHEYVERGAREYPRKRAFEFATCLELHEFKSQSWTYEQLDEEGNRVAQLLVQHNVVPGQLVAICFDKCAEASLAIVGILKAGCAYVALDPNAPEDRMRFIVEDSGAKMILTSGKPAREIEASLSEDILSFDLPKALEGYPSDPVKLSRDISPQDTCYCLYTSGTTGVPKGCLITHENAVQAMLSFQRLFAPHWTEDSKWLQFASFHFDVSVLEQFWSWSVGICVASAPRDLIFEDIPGAIRQLGITHIDLTPSLARLLHPDDVPSLCKGVFITGGEQLKQEILDVWGEHSCIYNGYGPTEATIGVTMYPRVPKNGKPSNIGPQFDNVGSFVLKPGTALPALRGGIGELCVSGKLVGKGYLNRPDLTAEKFPTLETLNERVYRTGDLVRILHDGSFIFLGRADDQVKLRGQRVELSEINEVIKKSQSDLQEVVTLVLKHKTQQKEQLVTFFVQPPYGDTLEDTLISNMRNACKSRLPGYMVPTHFVPIKALPLNANNKADSKQLAAMYDDMSADTLQNLIHSSQQDNQWTENEKRVLDIVAEIEHVEVSALNKGTSIFELGLDSISIIGFCHALQKAGLSNARISIVRNNPTMEKLAEALLNENNANQGGENAYVAAAQDIVAFSQRHMISVCNELDVESMEIESIAPCTPIQEGMIYQFLESQRPLYFHTFDFQLNGEVDTDKLLAAWYSVISQLQILRTKFIVTDDGYAQVVLKNRDASRNSSFDYDMAEKSAALRNPFTFAITTTSSGNCMSIRIFHGLYDGNSLTMMLRRVVDEYNGLSDIEYGPSFHSILPYGPLAKAPGAEQFWRNHLANWSYHPLSTKEPQLNSVVATSVVTNLSGFEELRKKLGVTPQAMIQATWVSVLQEITSPNLTIGMVTSGRAMDFEGAEKVIGPLFNTVPFHAKTNAGMKASSLIFQCHEFNMQMQELQHTPLKDIQKWTTARPGQPIFDTLFVFQRSESDEEEFAKEMWTQIDGEQTAEYPLAFEATLDSECLSLRLAIVAQGSAINESRAVKLLDKFEHSLQAILGDAAGNTIVEYGTSTNSVDGTAHRSVEPPMPTVSDAASRNGSHQGPFQWTKEAIEIRHQIALLAEVDEDSVHESSSIFELGLDSIDVIKLSSRLKRHGIAIPVSAIIKSQNIGNMSSTVSKRDSKTQKVPTRNRVQEMSQDLTVHLKRNRKLPDDTEAVLPATPLQQSMVNEMIKSNYKRYFTVEAFELDRKTELSKLVAAVGEVILASPILRTTFAEIDDPRSPVSFAQIVHTNHIYISELSEEGNLESLLDQFKTESSVLAASIQALCQVKFVSIGRTGYMLMAISHALYDGKSLRTLHEDIWRAYHDDEKFLPRPNYTPFLELAFQSTTEDAKKFWRSALLNLPPAVFPKKLSSELPKPSVVHRAEARSSIPLKDVESFCRSSRITLQTVGQTCWALVLSHLMGQLDVVFGSVLSCRDSEEAEEVMFPLMNTVAVRSVIHGSVSDMLKYMQEMSDSIRQYQHFPLGAAQAFALAARERGSSTKDTTLFDTLFIYQGRNQTKENESLYKSVYGASDVEFPICVEMEIVEDRYLSWTTACKSVARGAAETKDIITALDTVLQRIIAIPHGPTFVSDAGGISVCGLPKFRKPGPPTSQVPRPAKKSTSETWSDLELKIRAALQEVSNAPQDTIHKDSTIFHLGLDSILVLKLPALLRHHGIKLSVSAILRDQTISAMAQSVLRADLDNQDSLDVDDILSKAVSPLVTSAVITDLERDIGEVQSIYPVTAGQLYMVQMWQNSRGALFYPSFTYAISIPVDRSRLDAAWRSLLQFHDILRTGFVEIDSELFQAVFKNPQNAVIYQTSESQPTLKSLSDLRRPPVTLTVEGSDKSNTRLSLEIHHALYDGISLPLLVDQLQSLYRGQTLPTPELSFRSFLAQSIAASKRSPSQESTSTTALGQEKWQSYIQHESLYPTKTSPINSNQRTEVFHSSLQASSLKKFAQDTGVSVDALLLAATSKLYARRLNATSPITQIVFGIYLANRAPFGEDLSTLAAPTLNLLPLCVRDPLGRELPEIAKAIQRDLQEISSAEMSCASLDDIWKWCGVRVNFFVNILKEMTLRAAVPSGEAVIFEPVQDLTEREKVVDQYQHDGVDGHHDAYLPAVDVEIRYHGEVVDMGVFAPATMVSVSEGAELIKEFAETWA